MEMMVGWGLRVMRPSGMASGSPLRGQGIQPASRLSVGDKLSHSRT